VPQSVKSSDLNYVAIDFSLNSPGICIYNDKGKKYHFISYIKPKTGTKAEQRFQEEISQLKDVTVVYQPDFTQDTEYSSQELSKIKRYDKMASDIINIIRQHSYENDGYHIAFEGSSYGSKMGTNNIIDMAAGAAVLKLKMLKTMKPEDIETIAPTTIKKHAGKGNMSKQDLCLAFLNNVNGDLSLLKGELFHYCSESEIDPKGKKIPKPLDDLIDAYFLVSLIASKNQAT
jgi:hypothetical protein